MQFSHLLITADGPELLQGLELARNVI